MGKAYELSVQVKVKMPEGLRQLLLDTEPEWTALAACPRCGALAAERDIARNAEGRIDPAASFVLYACGNFTGGGEAGALACSLHNLREAIVEAFTPFVAALERTVERISARFRRRRRQDPVPRSRILHGPATVYIGAIGDPDQEPTWHEIGHTVGDLEVR